MSEDKDVFLYNLENREEIKKAKERVQSYQSLMNDIGERDSCTVKVDIEDETRRRTIRIVNDNKPDLGVHFRYSYDPEWNVLRIEQKMISS